MSPPLVARVALPAAASLRALIDPLLSSHRGPAPAPPDMRPPPPAAGASPWWEPARVTPSC